MPAGNPKVPSGDPKMPGAQPKMPRASAGHQRLFRDTILAIKGWTKVDPARVEEHMRRALRVIADDIATPDKADEIVAELAASIGTYVRSLPEENIELELDSAIRAIAKAV